MLKRLTISSIFFMVLLLNLSVSAQPVLETPAYTYDFGFTPQNASVNCDFWLHSTGTDTLKITQIKTTCGCTKAPLVKDVLAPGDSTRLEIIFKTGRFQNQVSKSIQVNSNSGQPPHKLFIKSNIIVRPDSTYPVIIKPYKLNISQFSEKIRNEMTFNITNVSDRDLSPVLITSGKDLFEVVLPKEIKAGETVEAILKLTEAALKKEFNNSFTVEFNDEKNSRITVPVLRNMRLADSSSGKK